MTDNYFNVLNAVNVQGKTEKKNGLTYLSWAWAWAEVKKRFPEANYTIYENSDGWCYHTDGRTCWVKTGVTVNGIEHIEYLPVMDFRNQSIPVDKVTSFDVNKAIQRSLTKAVARHGLGLYIYAGEDIPEGEEPAPLKGIPTGNVQAKTGPVLCEVCGTEIKPYTGADGKTVSTKRLVERSKEIFGGRILCTECARAQIGGFQNV